MSALQSVAVKDVNHSVGGDTNAGESIAGYLIIDSC